MASLVHEAPHFKRFSRRLYFYAASFQSNGNSAYKDNPPPTSQCWKHPALQAPISVYIIANGYDSNKFLLR